MKGIKGGKKIHNGKGRKSAEREEKEGKKRESRKEKGCISGGHDSQPYCELTAA